MRFVVSRFRPRRSVSVASAVLLCPVLFSTLAVAQFNFPEPSVETVVLFDAEALETPESIVFDRRDNAYISLALTGEIRKLSADGQMTGLARLPIGAPCGGFPVAVLGLAIDHRDQLYVSVSACDPTNNGVWHVDAVSGEAELIARLPSRTVANGLDLQRGQIYIADTFGGMIWRAFHDGGAAEIWADHPLLERPADAIFPGPNGLKVFRNEVYVANSATAQIVAFPILPSGAAGEPRVHADMPGGEGCDEFAFDQLGRLYCTTDPFNTVVRIFPDGSSEILLTAADGLDGPTSVAFGRRGKNRHHLYITNAAFPIFTTTFRPSLMRLQLEIAGAFNPGR